MKWSFRIAKIAGTEVRIHGTFILLLLWVGVSFLIFGGIKAALVSVVFIGALFLCVLLHEFGHVFAARQFGIPTPDITLLPIGGLARMQSIPKRPSQELIIALAGPAVNVIIAATLIAITGLPSLSFGADLHLADASAIVPQLVVVNLWLAVFNMIPAFPMDGGRVLRAMLALIMDHTRATDIAARIGQALAITGGMIGFAIGHPILVLIAIFIYFGAAQENASTSIRDALEGIPVRNAMLTDFVSMAPGSTIRDATNALLAGSQQHFPVVDDAHALLGLATREQIISALAEHGMEYPITKVMQPCSEALAVDTSTIEALEALQASKCPVLPVVDPDKHILVGLLTSENVAEMMLVTSALRRHSTQGSSAPSQLLQDGKGFQSAVLRTRRPQA